jgi:hypothetical protein
MGRNRRVKSVRESRKRKRMRATTHWSGKREELVRTQEKKGGRSPHSLEHAEFGAGQGAGKSEPVGAHQ